MKEVSKTYTSEEYAELLGTLHCYIVAQIKDRVLIYGYAKMFNLKETKTGFTFNSSLMVYLTEYIFPTKVDIFGLPPWEFKFSLLLEKINHTEVTHQLYFRYKIRDNSRENHEKRTK
ncbi:hypothetical protein JHD46_05395 [Sulfurimonas sp. SAG-AH-194-C20]|nr:hypothetical protein [Sulfurimonas sp. SAG-AH-194-C20]MDF1879074.1 hypothetical protein [Sulfurimonas sp. SAG-AH-194-C20]